MSTNYDLNKIIFVDHLYESIMNKTREDSINPFLLIIVYSKKEDDLAYLKSIVNLCISKSISYTISMFPKAQDAKTLVLDKTHTSVLVIGEQTEEYKATSSTYDTAITSISSSYNNSTIDLKEIIPIEKDIDCYTYESVKRHEIYKKSILYYPLVAKSVIELIKDDIKFDLLNRITTGSVAILGRGKVGRYMADAITHIFNGTVTILHSESRLSVSEKILRDADLIITCASKAGSLTGNFIAENVAIIDVGICTDENGKLCGNLCKKCIDAISANEEIYYTTVPNGIGKLCTAMLYDELCSYKKRHNKEKSNSVSSIVVGGGSGIYHGGSGGICLLQHDGEITTSKACTEIDNGISAIKTPIDTKKEV